MQITKRILDFPCLAILNESNAIRLKPNTQTIRHFSFVWRIWRKRDEIPKKRTKKKCYTAFAPKHMLVETPHNSSRWITYACDDDKAKSDVAPSYAVRNSIRQADTQEAPMCECECVRVFKKPNQISNRKRHGNSNRILSWVSIKTYTFNSNPMAVETRKKNNDKKLIYTHQ